ncbi:GntR family transcriptional regulator [Frigoribacterium faeni]|uniref:DNA-binding transcriptional regulator YhcF (GntR family) n=1 Tax=Frigoribacterium faeni TaxID=145483 RepID=A0A7W3JKJ0_9MICO|nr:GntR family transcriptional regulator [Frigoribacterium faeni]MBA8814480.1 DNA-binding transcriptional regulator YhcF (GntR family) [Frigoribacterium faeni]BFF16010.1 GntR family transcriptional regulator [Microbacterium flavescens]GEK84115.1 GntR family transcriptional regulator [Frigoribacterium faeni]
MFDESTPIFQQLADRIEQRVLDGTYPEDEQVASTNEFAAFYRINPATAGKAVNLLVDRGILYKRRGVGMFVAAGARDRLSEQRRAAFAAGYVRPLMREAAALGIDLPTLMSLIEQENT